MSPDRDFYTKDENFKGWEKTFAANILEKVGFMVRIGTDERSLTAFSIPDGQHLGFGQLIIPLRVPDRRGGRKIKHAYSEIAAENSLFFYNPNRFQEVLDTLGVNRKKGENVGEFYLSSHSTLDGWWYIQVDRKHPDRIVNWRKHTEAQDFPRSAVGLATAFAQRLNLEVTQSTGSVPKS
jgi:hypothetical protein